MGIGLEGCRFMEQKSVERESGGDVDFGTWLSKGCSDIRDSAQGLSVGTQLTLHREVNT